MMADTDSRMTPPQTVVLASGSAVRAALLRSAGVSTTVDIPGVDEAEIKAGMLAEGADAAAIAETLAQLKAQRVSQRHRQQLVVGADQVLSCDGRLYDKPGTLTEAREQLLSLRGRRHQLSSAVALVRGGNRLWHHIGRATLTMREFSEDFLDHYLQATGKAVCEIVGGYQLEGLGSQLFADVDGDYFTILGLPLLPLLDILREQGVLRR